MSLRIILLVDFILFLCILVVYLKPKYDIRMGLLKKLFCCLLLLLLPFGGGISLVFAADNRNPVLIISSYNPDSQQTSGNISDFIGEFKHLGGTLSVALENMNCKSFSEAPVWKARMNHILSKYNGDRSPSLIVLIGQEAWAAYLSQDDAVKGTVPVLTALASRNAVILPNDSTNLKTWMPKAVDFFDDFADSNIKAGFVYEYDVKANLELIMNLYPQTRNIAFISDNSYGGVAMQAHVVEQMKKYPELKLILLDGRENTIYTISDKLHMLPEHTALLLGTWRVDMNDGYFMRNATYAMMEASFNIPTFSLSSVGMGYWAIGGVVPNYQPLGKRMARQAVEMLEQDDIQSVAVQVIPNKVIMDYKIVKERELNLAFIKESIEFVNEKPSLYAQYKYRFWGIGGIIITLSLALLILYYYYYRTKKLKDELEVSEIALREAKERAEESNHLKGAFLANMSHEIRTPLNAIVGFSDVLTIKGISREDHDSFVNIIKTNTNTLLRLVNNVLEVSRLEKEQTVYDQEYVDAVPLCQQALSLLHREDQTKQLLFECDQEAVYLRTDSQRLQQVISNLLSNANKYTQEGTITLRIAVDEKRKKAIFSVADTGCGIPLDKQSLVFERFERLDDFEQGSGGLGLSICKLIVEKWAGEIWIDPEYTEGARFVFTHPYEAFIQENTKNT